MRPFNLEEALAGKPVVTRKGHPVTQLTRFEGIKSHYPLRAVANEELLRYTVDGRYVDEDTDHIYDLFMAPETYTRYFNVYRSVDGKPYIGVLNYETEEKAIENKIKHAYIKTIPVTFTV